MILHGSSSSLALPLSRDDTLRFSLLEEASFFSFFEEGDCSEASDDERLSDRGVDEISMISRGGLEGLKPGVENDGRPPDKFFRTKDTDGVVVGNKRGGGLTSNAWWS
jgi:hypothetical protein